MRIVLEQTIDLTPEMDVDTLKSEILEEENIPYTWDDLISKNSKNISKTQDWEEL